MGSSYTTASLFQGPLPNTCGNFWEMVWEQRSRGVVMLNRVIEKGSVSTSSHPHSRNFSLSVPFSPSNHSTFWSATPCVLSTLRSNVPNTGLTGRRKMLYSRIPTLSSPLSQKTLNLTTRFVSWSWRICL